MKISAENMRDGSVEQMKKKPVILIIVIVLLLAIIAGGAYYFLVARKSQSQKKTQESSYTYELDDAFVTNVKDSQKLFKASVVLVLDTDKLQDTLKKEQPVIRDTILFMFRDLTEEDICSDTIQDKLRKEIPAAINKKLHIKDVVSVYFGDFVMQ